MQSSLSLILFLATAVSGQAQSPIINSGACTATGPWKVSPSLQSDTGWLTADLDTFNGKAEDVAVVFKPRIDTNANYSITMYTPGCLQSDTCNNRQDKVNLYGEYLIGNATGFTNQISQSNNLNKYDNIYNGYINASSNNFSPSLKLAPMTGSKGIVVAQRIQINMLKDSALDPNAKMMPYVVSNELTCHS